MARRCTVCTHSDRPAIDAAIVADEPLRLIADRFGVSFGSVQRHQGHIAEAIQAAAQQAAAQDARHGAAAAQLQASQEVAAARQALDVVQQLKAINGVTLHILKTARDGDNHKIALQAIDRIQRQIELQARLLGDLDDRPVVNVLISPQWIELRAVIIQALAPYPDARTAVIAALEGVDRG